MKKKWVYTEVRGEIISCEILEETGVSYSLIAYFFSETLRVIRAKTECFTDKTKALKYFELC